ncbi:unnamed protein product [marine sediment metagenome]|uniref:Uncharacterized protein n=1 Tax=marine sediment metagenome TaxID=412755 RepID=X0TUH8_9ZZZZ
MVEIHLYGKLRLYAGNLDTAKEHVISISPQTDETIESLLARMEISAQDIYSIFLNGKLLATRSGMARWMGYQQIRNNPFDWDLNIAVSSGDRIGLFGRDMAALVI